MEELTSILEAVDNGDLSPFTDEQLTEHADKIREYGLSLRKDKPTADEIEDAVTLAAALKTVTEEIGKRETVQAELQAKADEAFSAFGDPKDPDADDDDDEDEEPAPATTPPNIIASRPSAAEVAKRRPPAAEPKGDEHKALVASAGEQEFSLGNSRFKDAGQLADIMYSTWNRLPADSGPRAVARIPVQHQYELKSTDAVDNARVLSVVAAKTQQARNEGVALTAALGCAPSEPVYEFFNQCSGCGSCRPSIGDRSARFADLSAGGWLHVDRRTDRNRLALHRRH